MFHGFLTFRKLLFLMIILSSFLFGFRSNIAFWNQEDQFANCPGGSVFSAAFVDSINNRGQGWRYSNSVTITGLTGGSQTLRVYKVPAGANTGVRVNGSHTSGTYNGSNWVAEVTVTNGDVIQLAGVTNVAGGTSVEVEADICGSQYSWTASTKDYGANNCTNLTSPRTCTGSIIQSFFGGGPNHHLIGGCIDWAQEYGTGARCVERIGDDCFVYDGARATASSSASDCGS